MCLYNRKTVNLLAITITTIIFFILNQINFKDIKFNIVNSKENFKVEDSNNIIQQTNENYISSQNNTTESESEMIDYDWYIKIPKIDLIAPIEETVEKEVMNRSVGHFSNTSKWDGNVGLGAHNRGYDVNYFANIKKLKKFDLIEYGYNGTKRQYLVSNIVIIKDTDWSYLEETEENKITLITCVENEPNYRRCIQGIEKTN